MRALVVVVTALVVVGAGAPLVAASGAGSGASVDATTSSLPAFDTQENGTENGSENESIPPGAQLAGVVNVQAAEVEGEVQQRSFGLQVAAARSNASRAAVVATQAGELNETLATLQAQKRSLVEAKQNGSISQARFRAEMAGLAAEISTARQLSNATVDTAATLPRAELEANGVNVTALQQLRTSASNLSGPEVSSIARSIAGAPSGSAGPPFDLGPDGPGIPGVPGAGDDNRSVGPGENVTVGPDGNLTVTPDGNLTVGPDGNVTIGPDENVTADSDGNLTVSPDGNLSSGGGEDGALSNATDGIDGTDDATGTSSTNVTTGFAFVA